MPAPVTGGGAVTGGSCDPGSGADKQLTMPKTPDGEVYVGEEKEKKKKKKKGKKKKKKKKKKRKGGKGEREKR
ncbi:hypothetical protein R6874_02085, partial [Mycobacterium tuberculosis]|uniref:hypothetical protein n=1 Tax=Mycobacterium tuberculosis TaxID=1773 RepID=UPI0034CF5444